MIVANSATNTITVAGRSVQLSPGEFKVLRAIYRSMPMRISIGSIVWMIWGGENEPDMAEETVRVQLYRARRKLAAAGIPLIIESRSGPGGGVMIANDNALTDTAAE